MDDVVYHGLIMAEAGWRAQPTVGRTTVNSILLNILSGEHGCIEVSNPALNYLHCATVTVSYMKLTVGQEPVTFDNLHLDSQYTDLPYFSVQ